MKFTRENIPKQFVDGDEDLCIYIKELDQYHVDGDKDKPYWLMSKVLRYVNKEVDTYDRLTSSVYPGIMKQLWIDQLNDILNT